ncbi:hypothetical protein HDV03_000840 [Kappamyces sp. JEL0829]|nr:hypothetical protein HDV03_000840 [Kappamyces sp. JEL0829]
MDDVEHLIDAPKRLNGCETPFHPIQSVTLIYMVMSPVLVSVLVLPYLASFWLYLASVVLAISWTATVVLGSITMHADPGAGAGMTPEESDSHATVLYCSVCRVDVHHDAMHCKYCNKCIRRLDHHCFYINNCIGSNNYRTYIGSMVSLFIFSGVVLASFIAPFAAGTTALGTQNAQGGIDAGAAMTVWYVFAALQCLFSLLVEGFLAYLLSLHLILTLYNITTLEYSRAKRIGRIRYFCIYKKGQVDPEDKDNLSPMQNQPLP